MSSSVHFRFKSAREFETLSFEGDFLKVAELKVAIVERKKLNFGEGFDLEISDAATGDVFNDESALVQKNTSVIVRRIPGLKQGGILSHQEMAAKNERYAEKQATKPHQHTATPGDQNTALPKTIQGSDEAERIASLVMQSNVQYDQFPPPVRARYSSRPNNRGRSANFAAVRNPQGQSSFPNPAHSASAYPDRAPRPSSNYVCHRCNRPGHWIDLCPTNGDPTYDRIKVRAPTGIPRSMLRQVDAPESGTGLQDSSGHFVTLQPNEEEFARQTVGLRLSQAAASGVDKDVDSSMVVKDGDSISKGDENDASSNGPHQASEDDAKQNARAQSTNGLQEVLGKPSHNSKETRTDSAKEEPNGSSRKASMRLGVSQGPGPEHHSYEPNTKRSEQGIPKPQGKSAPVSLQTQQLRPPKVEVPNIPIPGIPPGFPPLGMPPIPPGMPPIPPHILVAMAMTNGQNGRPPQLPPGMYSNMSIPFSTSVPSTMDKKNQDVVTETQRASSEQHQLTSDGASPEDSVRKGLNRDRKLSPEGGSPRDVWDRNEEGHARDEEMPDQQGVDHPSSELIDSALNSKPDSHPSRVLRLDRRDTRALKQLSLHDNENGLRSEYQSHIRKETNYRSRSPSSSRVHSTLEEVEISPRRRERRDRAKDFNTPLSPRQTAFEKIREDRRTRAGRRSERNMRYRSSRSRKDVPGDESSRDGRRDFYSRKQSRSPSPRERFGMNGAISSDSPVGRKRSPERRSRYSSPGLKFRENRSRGWRGKESPERRFRRDSSTERRLRSRTPPRSSGYNSRGREDFYPRQHSLSGPRRSSSVENGRDLAFARGSDEGRRYEPADRVRPTMSGSERDEHGPRRRVEILEQYPMESHTGTQDLAARSSEDSLDERRVQHDVRKNNRRKREFDRRRPYEQGELKRPRREHMERELVSYQEIRGRPSVHDRLGRPVESRRRKRPRRSVHDRLG